MFYLFFLFKIQGIQSVWPKVGLFFLAIYLGIICCLINHNHRHYPIFYSHRWNQMLNLWLTVLIGAPSTRMHVIHHFNHHFYYPGLEDWTHQDRCRKGSIGIWKIVTYCFYAMKNIFENREKLELSKRNILSLKRENLALRFYYVFLFGVSFKVSFIPVILMIAVNFCSQLLLLISNLLNHDECPLDKSPNGARDFTSKVENWFFFNNGYHSVHHVHPTMHWSKLKKEFDEKFYPHKSAQFMDHSFFLFLLKYIFRYEYKKL